MDVLEVQDPDVDAPPPAPIAKTADAAVPPPAPVSGDTARSKSSVPKVNI